MSRSSASSINVGKTCGSTLPPPPPGQNPGQPPTRVDSSVQQNCASLTVTLYEKALKFSVHGHQEPCQLTAPACHAAAARIQVLAHMQVLARMQVLACVPRLLVVGWHCLCSACCRLFAAMQVKTEATDGYNAVQTGYRVAPERKVKKPELGHLQKAGCPPMRTLREWRVRTRRALSGWRSRGRGGCQRRVLRELPRCSQDCSCTAPDCSETVMPAAKRFHISSTMRRMR
eukprot:364972-Chlamydomonas_euryale.AAC.4